ncbi:MAG: DEAD/DEAH box helicase [Erysipelotrichaceae bacterium]|nr:DEAD/DEAH box helicase [Erysipelotrichaceae bacterium]
MECLRCGNKDLAYFYKGAKGYYCRKCIKFSRVLLEEEPESFNYEVGTGVDEYRFDYELTPEQKETSHNCLKTLTHSDVLLYCVCGAGKTEISVESISYYLSKGLKVAYAIARKEVVIELGKRFKQIFAKAKVISVYGGHHEELSGDLIVCTCHQLYRYYRTFDLLILDEVDAFPLKGNQTLMNIAINSCKGRIIFSTATVDDELKKILIQRNVRTVELYTRPSRHPLSIPRLIYLNRYLALIYLYRVMSLMANQCIIFVSNKKECRNLYRLFSNFFSCTYVYADLKERNENINAFKENRKRFIFSTTVLERGITIRNISVIILNFSRTFDESNFVQMLGRVGRGIGNDEGETYLISDHYSKQISRTMDYLKKANSYL